MRRIGGLALVLLASATAGCYTQRWPDTPLLARANPFDTGNEFMVATDNPGPEAYAALFERVLDVIDDDFKIALASRYNGRIEAQPKIAPGLEQPFKPGSPSVFERLLYSCQTYRYRCLVLIQPAEHGYLINVTVLKELEDLPNPTRETGGGAAFRSDPNIDRTYEVVDPTVVSHVWIPKGRDGPLEQKILRKIKWKLRE